MSRSGGEGRKGKKEKSELSERERSGVREREKGKYKIVAG